MILTHGWAFGFGCGNLTWTMLKLQGPPLRSAHRGMAAIMPLPQPVWQRLAGLGVRRHAASDLLALTAAALGP